MDIISHTDSIVNHWSIPSSDLTAPARKLFEGLFGDYFDRYEADLCLSRKLTDGRYKREFHAGTSYALDRVIDCHLDRVNTFFSIAPLARRERPSTRKTAIKDILTLHVDIDCPSNSIAQFERRLKREQPSAITLSGHGLHGYIFLDKPTPATPQNIQIIESLNKSLSKLFGSYGDPAAHDVSRLLRVPNTFNVKDPKNPKLVELLELEGTRRYSLEELVARFGGESDRQLEDSHNTLRFAVKGEDRLYLDKLLDKGLFEPQSRNRAKMLLTRYAWEQGLSLDAAKDFVNGWFENNHNNHSRDWLLYKRVCIAENNSCVGNWFKKAGTKRQVQTTFKLSDPDTNYIRSLNLPKRDTTFLIEALTYILNNQRNNVIFLSARQLQRFAYTHQRNYKRRAELLINHGFIELLAEGKRTERKATEYRVLYNPRQPLVM